MFEFVRTHNRLLQFVLVLLIFPSFVFFGIQGYSRFTGDGNTTVAKVAGRAITQAEWDAAHQEQIERVRRQMPGIDVKLFDTPEMKRQSLEGVVREHVMLAAVDQFNLATSTDRLMRNFRSDPQFASIRDADGWINKDALAAVGMSSEVFVERLRQDLSMRQVLQGVAGTEFAPTAVAASALDAYLQQRDIHVQRFESKDYLTKVHVSDAELEKYYKDPANAVQFQAPEQASIEYVVLDLEALMKSVAVSDEDLRKYYSENEARYITPEERNARHILIKVDKKASAAERAKAKAKAQTLLAEVKKAPGTFAEVARKNSEDPGSAPNGGDLGFFARGAMVKPFEDAAFSLKPGDVSDLVETDFGYHIIQLTAARGGVKRSFEAVRSELEAEVRKQLAQKKFSEVAGDFTNMVYEQADNLKPVIEKFKLELHTAQGVKRVPQPGAAGPLASAKFLEAIFRSDSIRDKRNTDAVEIGTNQLVSGRIVQYSPAHQLALKEVSDKVRDKVAVLQATALARKDGEARLAELKKAPQMDLPGESLLVSRVQSKDLPRSIIDAALRADAGALPAFVGVDLGEQGYAVVRVNKILGRDPVAGDIKQAQAQYAQAWGDAQTQAYYAALKKRFKVEVNEHAQISDAAASAVAR